MIWNEQKPCAGASDRQTTCPAKKYWICLSNGKVMFMKHPEMNGGMNNKKIMKSAVQEGGHVPSSGQWSFLLAQICIVRLCSVQYKLNSAVLRWMANLKKCLPAYGLLTSTSVSTRIILYVVAVRRLWVQSHFIYRQHEPFFPQIAACRETSLPSVDCPKYHNAR